MSWVGLVFVVSGLGLIGLAQSGATRLGLGIVSVPSRQKTAKRAGFLLVLVGALMLGVYR